MKRRQVLQGSALGMLSVITPVFAKGNDEMNALTMTTTWDKIFPLSPNVEHRKVSFNTRFGVTLAADLYRPKNRKGKLPAIAVSGPFGAVKEQSSGLYAQTLAEAGFLTIAFDPSFTGESGGFPRHVASPDICTEDFSAAVDYLSNLDGVDANRIGILGICGWGGFALNAAAGDPRIKAVLTSTMYDMSRVNTLGYFDKMTDEDRWNAKIKLTQQRTEDFANQSYARAGRLPAKLSGKEPFHVKQYWEFYCTPRGFHPRSINSNGTWNATSPLSFMNTPLLTYIGDIRCPALLIHGEKAHSRYFSEDAFKKLKGNNKELLIIPGATHTDLYDNTTNKIPFKRIVSFYQKALG